jgi:Leucine-rich repeat (LRR) protein
MGTTSSKEPRTGSKVTAQKLETAQKTGVLSLTGHGFKEVPSGVWAIEKMTTLDLTNNKLTSLDGSSKKKSTSPSIGGIGSLRLLKTLKLDKNELLELPVAVSILDKLTNFTIGDNRIGPLNGLARLPTAKLIKLEAPRNSVGALDCCLHLTKLQVLNLSGNGISRVPEELGDALTSLLELNLDDNLIEVVPPEAIVGRGGSSSGGGGLRKLKILSLRNNRVAGNRIESTGFQTLPAVLFSDTKLERLNLEGNPITKRQLSEFDGSSSWLERQSKTKQKDLALYCAP